MSEILERLAQQMHELQLQVAELAKDLRFERAIVMALMAQHGDPTHLSVKRAAELRGCSRRTIDRDIERGVYVLEIDPMTGDRGIPIAQFYTHWTPIGSLRQAISRESGDTLKKQKRHG